MTCVSDALQSFGISDVLDKEMVLVRAERSPLLVGGGTDYTRVHSMRCLGYTGPGVTLTTLNWLATTLSLVLATNVTCVSIMSMSKSAKNLLVIVEELRGV